MTTSIQPIAKESVQRIVAGQAILDLASCVKELVDNALDAGSKSINIRLFGKGLDIVEVSDDGTGVPKNSRDQLAVPYATSKITTFDDIYEQHSLGFRGEALYSLSNLSQKLIVATRTADEPMAQKLEFHHDGTLDEAASCAEMPRKVGTTVAVVRLLDQLPVRRRDLEQRITAHRAKLVQLMTAYAIFRTGVRIHLMDVDSSSGKEKTIVASSFQNQTISSTISAVLGPKFLSGMAKFTLDLTSVYEGDGSSAEHQWKVEGLISSASGKSITKSGHQFYAIHQRPVELSKLSRILKSSFQLYQDRTPSIILDFTIPINAYDINVSPDKRTVLLKSEELLFEKIQLAAAELWASQVDGTFQPRRRYAFVHDPSRAVEKEAEESAKRSQFELQDTVEQPQVESSLQSEDHDVEMPAKASASCVAQVEDRRDSRESVATMPPRQLKSVASSNVSFASTWKERQKWRDAQVRFNSRDEEDEEPLATAPALKMPSKRAFGLERFGFVAKSSSKPTPRVVTDDSMTPRPTEEKELVPRTAVKDSEASNETHDISEIPNVKVRQVSLGESIRSIGDECKVSSPKSWQESPSPSRLHQRTSQSSVPISPRTGESEVVMVLQSSSSQDPTEDGTGKVLDPQPVFSSAFSESSASLTPKVRETSKSVCIWSHFGTSESTVASYQAERQSLLTRKRKLKELISKGKEEDPQQDVSIKLKKEEFKHMSVIGQFNMGFILATDSEGNLWILDQHACDERSTFERLCLETTIHQQNLMRPLKMSLSSLQEACIQDNLEIFEKNGFRFQYDETESPGQRFSLTALPHSGAPSGQKSVQYGKDDVIALCSLLLGEEVHGGTGTEGNGIYGNNAVRRYASSSQPYQAETIMARLPKTIAMFASRACRASIMIGTALSQKEMEKLVNRLADVNQPWSCPHGRPTLQHVGHLSSAFLKDEKLQESLIAEPTVTVLSQDYETM